MKDYTVLLPILVPVIGGLATALLSGMLTGGSTGRRSGAGEPAHSGIMRIIIPAILAVEAVCTGISVVVDRTLVLWNLSDKLLIVLRGDMLTRIFAVLVAAVWFLVGIYAVNYMSHDDHQVRFFVFYLIAEGMIMAVAYAGNMITFYMFFEMMTMLTFPLVMHDMTRTAIRAGLKYLFYSVAGAFMTLFGIFALTPFGVLGEFRPGGMTDIALASGNRNLFLVSAMLMIAGLGTKAGIFPMHAWLPAAHPEAPAPASAVLSGIITKTGVIGVIRVVYFCIGPRLIAGTWVQNTWIALALITVFMGSMMAYREQVFKKRLAYSTVSQVSYIMLGLSMLNYAAYEGAVMHMVFHALIKTVLFLAAGTLIHKTGRVRVDEYPGIGRSCPVTMWCYTLSSLALIGIPPLSGFVSKWYLAEGALKSGTDPVSWIACAVLLISALLTAGYLLPVTIRGFFAGREAGDGENADGAAVVTPECDGSVTGDGDETSGDPHETDESAYDIIPMMIMTAATVVFGIFPGPLLSLIEHITSVVM